MEGAMSGGPWEPRQRRAARRKAGRQTPTCRAPVEGGRPTRGGLSMSESKAGVEQPQPHRSALRKKPLRRNRSLPLTDAEYQLIDEAARLCGKTTRAFIREAALGVPLKADPFLADAELIREAGRNGLAIFPPS